MHCSMVSPCVIHPGNAGTVTVYPPSSVSGSRIIVYFRIIDSPLMYALFSHPLLTPIIPMGQLNRKGDKAVKQGFANVFFLFPSPPQKRGKERVAALARPRQSGNTLLIHLGWGLYANQSDVLEALVLSASLVACEGESCYN